MLCSAAGQLAVLHLTSVLAGLGMLVTSSSSNLRTSTRYKDIRLLSLFQGILLFFF